MAAAGVGVESVGVDVAARLVEALAAKALVLCAVQQRQCGELKSSPEGSICERRRRALTVRCAFELGLRDPLHGVDATASSQIEAVCQLQ